jgi:Protein of unknown function (DUF1173)
LISFTFGPFVAIALPLPFPNFKLAPCDPWWQQIARRAYVSRHPLFCACMSPGIEAPMVLVQAHGTYVAKPIPLTGPRHASSCDHYRQPDALSGRGEVAGTEPFFPIRPTASRIRQRRAKKLRRLKEPDSRMLIISEWRCLESTHLGSMLKRARDPTCC